MNPLQLILLIIPQFYMEKWLIRQQIIQEHLVPFPERQVKYIALRDPFQLAFTALRHSLFAGLSRIEIHVLVFPSVTDEFNEPAQRHFPGFKSGLLPDFPPDAFLRCFTGFDLSSDADPFSLIEVILLFVSEQHQVHAVLLNITQRRI